MPIVVTCSTPQDSVFFGGELFSCEITISNRISTLRKPILSRIPSLTPSVQSQSTISRFASFFISPSLESPPPSDPAGKHVRSISDVASRTAIGAHEVTSPPSFISERSGPSRPPKLDTTAKVPAVKDNIAWAFAQMTGSFNVDYTFIKKEMGFAVLSDKVFKPTANSRKVSYNTPGLSPGSVRKKTSYGGGSLSSQYSMHSKAQKLTDGLPLLNTPPSILFSDLDISPGESKTFTYEILLPAQLPPSYRGKVVRFSYKLVIGVQKTVSGDTQVITVPFRVFSRTNADGTRPIFNVLDPVIHHKDSAQVSSASSSDITTALSPITTFMNTPLSGGEGGSSISLHRGSTTKIEFDMKSTSIDNVLNHLQSLGRVSYDICKNTEHICQLTLPRIGYRLGESITISLDFSKSSIPCFHVSVFLESHESIASEFLVASRTKDQVSKLTKSLVDEFHQHVINSQRSVVTLNLPQTGSPDFSSNICGLVWLLRFEFITGSGAESSKLYHVSTEIDGFTHSRGLPDVEVEPFDCTIPLKVFGALKTTKLKRKVLDFELK